MPIKMRSSLAVLMLCYAMNFSVAVQAGSPPSDNKLTAGQLVGLTKGNDQERLIAARYVDGVSSALDEVRFCRPYNFEPEKLFGALEIQLTYNPFFYGQRADLLVTEVLEKLTPCAKKNKNPCVCFNRSSQ